MGAVLGAVAVLPEAYRQEGDQCPVVCRPEVGQCPAVSAPVAAGTPAAAVPVVACVPEVAGNPEVADDEEGAACGRHKQFCGPTRDRGHSNCRK
jgi:hypothetical protein